MATLWTKTRWERDEGVDTGLLEVLEWTPRAVKVELEDLGEMWLPLTVILNVDEIRKDLGDPPLGKPNKIDTIVIRTWKAKEMGLLDDE